MRPADHPQAQLSRYIFHIKLGLIVICLVLVGVGTMVRQVAAASCTPPANDLGTVTETLSVPTTGTYRLWSYMMAPSAADNSYMLEVDSSSSSSCYDVGGSGLTPDTWTWVDYQDGNVTSPINLTDLAAGTYTVKMIGNAPGVELDRIILTQDLTCIPTGTGDNCANPPNTTPPTISLTAPKTGTMISGSSVLSALASDNTAIASVSFYVDNSSVPVATVPTPAGASTTSPETYSYLLDTTTLSNGSHSLQARATDVAGNIATTPAIAVTVQNSGSTSPTCSPPSTPTNVTKTLSSYSSIGLSWLPSTPNGNCTLRGYNVFRDGVQVNPGLVTDASYTDMGLSANTTYQYTVQAVDSDNNLSPMSNAVGLSTETDAIAPVVNITVPSNGATISGNTDISGAATDNVAVQKVEVEIDGTIVYALPSSVESSSESFTYNWDTSGLANGNHSIEVLAFDEAGNIGSTASNVIVENGNRVPPSAPTGLTATTPAFDKVNLAWKASTDRSGGAVAGYYVLRNGSTIAKVGPVTTYSDTSVTSSTIYRYQLIAFDASGNNSTLSDAVSVTTPGTVSKTPPSVPMGLIASPVSSTQINLSWHARIDSTGVKGYNIYRAIGGIHQCSIAGALRCPADIMEPATIKIASDVSSTSFGDSGLTPATTYTYYVAALDNANNTSNLSAPASGMTYVLVPPIGITTGTLDGTISHTGTGFKTASIRLTYNGRTFTYSTAANGSYTILRVPSGSHGVNYSAAGFKTHQTTLTIVPGQIKVNNVRLRHT